MPLMPSVPRIHLMAEEKANANSFGISIALKYQLDAATQFVKHDLIAILCEFQSTWLRRNHTVTSGQVQGETGHFFWY